MGMPPDVNAMGERKLRVLTAVIESYIKTGEPVGSKSVVERLGNAVSSATIRNEMVDLANLGYLEQPHTSAGRIPTAAAFRMYIDRLMPRHSLTAKDMREIDALLSHAADDPTRLMSEASQALAEVTGCAAVSTAPSGRLAAIRRIDVLRISEHSAALLMMTDSGMLRSRVCRFGAAVSTEVLERLSFCLSGAFVGCPPAEVTLPQVQSLLAALGTDGLACAPALTAFHQLALEASDTELLLSGQLNLFGHHDYPQERLRDLLGFLSRRDMVVGMLTAMPTGLRVVLDGDGARPELDGTGIIVTRYSSADSDVVGGKIGIIGPLRMDYAAAIPRLEYFAKAVGRALNELFYS